jgi:hypothetical protein
MAGEKKGKWNAQQDGLIEQYGIRANYWFQSPVFFYAEGKNKQQDRRS